MPKRPHDAGISASWEVTYVLLPDNDLTRDCYLLAPSYFFGAAFAVESVTDAPIVDATFPRRVTARATVSSLLYIVLLRVQAGYEVSGDVLPPWALVDGSATDNNTGKVLGAGEMPPLFPAK